MSCLGAEEKIRIIGYDPIQVFRRGGRNDSTVLLGIRDFDMQVISGF